MISFYLIISLIFIVTIYLTIKFSVNKTSILDKENTLTLRGIAILGIVLHHISQYFYVYGAGANIFKNTGFIFVGVFFAISGYGNYLSYNKNNIEKRTVFKWGFSRILRLYISCFATIILATIPIFIFKNIGTLNIKDFLKDIITLTLPTWINWYLKIQLLLYVIFSIIYTYFKKNKTLIFNLSIMLLVVIMYILGFEPYWYNSCFCFCIGVLFAKYKDKILKLSNIKNILIIACLVVGVFFIKKYNYNIFSVFTCIGIVTAILLIDIMIPIKNKVLSIIGNISLEIYLVHLVLIRIFQFTNINENIEILILVILSCIIAFLLNIIVVKVQNTIMNIIYKKRLD